MAAFFAHTWEVRKLRLDIEAAFELDYSRCPDLTRLDIRYLAGYPNGVPFDRATGDFWRRLPDCPYLDALSIIGPPELDADTMRGDWGYMCGSLFGDMIEAKMAIHQPKLWKMVFEGGIFIEQVVLCIKAVLEPPLEQLELIIDYWTEDALRRRMREALLSATTRVLCVVKGLKLTVTEVDLG